MHATLVVRDRLDTLRSSLDGRLVRPGDTDWDSARQAFNLRADQRPVAVALVGSDRDVAAVVDAAVDTRLRVAAQTTGHNALPLGDLGDTVLVRTSALRGVEVDPVARTARVEAGAHWSDVVDAAAPYGLTALAGSSPNVGVVGYLLGGGLSWLARSHGLAVNHVLAFDVVTADGDHRRVDARRDPDLFWALRGGGGSFGIVTAVEMRLFPVAEVFAGALFFPVERAEEVLQTWRRWTATAPDEISSSARLLNFPPAPELPPHLSGRSLVVVDAASQLSADDSREVLAPLLDLGPELDTFAVVPARELSQLHMDPLEPVPAEGDGMLLREIDADAISTLVETVVPHSDTLLVAEMRQLGGAVAREATDGGAVSAFAAGVALFTAGVAPTAEAALAVTAVVDQVQRVMAPWVDDRRYLNFAERRTDGDALFGAGAHRRLREIKFAYDPDDRIRANQPVAPADPPFPHPTRSATGVATS